MSKISKLNVSQMMVWVMGAMVPALCFLTYWQGWGFLINLAVAVVSGVVFELIVGRMMSSTTPEYSSGADSPLRLIADGSAILTALLFAAGVPGFASPWVVIVGMFFAIVIAKHLFGGLGQNIFNPAMVAYAVVLIAFPTQMVIWPSWALHSVSAATPLDHANESILNHDLFPYFILNALWLFGGLILLAKRIIQWHIPAGFLLGMLLTALFFPDSFIQLGLGATMIGAFFIATDPVTAPARPNMRFIYGLLIGSLIIFMRQYSSYPDGLAFAILLGNICTPFMDQLSIRKSS